MKRAIFSYVLLIFLLAPSLIYSQLQITYPYQRMVIQRNLNNQGLLEIAGNISIDCDQIEVKLESYNGFPATFINWTALDTNPQNSYFKGTIQVKGGWYKVSARAVKNGQVVATDILEPVGIGEVFLISGQSNAEGNVAFSGANRGTSESRVITIDYSDIFLQEDILPYQFTSLSDNKKIGPYQKVPWIWAVMAENIVKEYQVPVLLLGAAVGGMGSELWYGSSRGIDYSVRFGRQVKFPGSPYGVISRTLKNYVSFTGIRAIIWQQGESDRLTSEQDYFRNISYIINQSRVDLQENIPWIIGESSRTPDVYFQVINAQKRLAQEVSNCYSGPNTDQLFGPFYRTDGIHFHNQGIIRAGELWFEAIKNQNLLSRIPSVSPKYLIEPTIQCSGTNSLSISIDNNGFSPTWSNNTTNRSVTIESGSIGAIIRDNSGIRYPFSGITIDNRFIRQPSLIADGATELCSGDELTLRSSDNQEVQWSTGVTAPLISVNKSGNYSFEFTNVFGCKNKTSNLSLSVKPKPQAVIIPSSPVGCEGDSIILSSSDEFSKYKWSNGASSKNTIIKSNGDFYLQVTNDEGCQSDSAFLSFSFSPRPLAPIITTSGVFGLETLEKINDSLNIEWLLNDVLVGNNTNYLKANMPGDYKARTFQLFGGQNPISCYSRFSEIISIGKLETAGSIRVYPIPSEGVLTMETIRNYENATITLYDLAGRLVFQQAVKDTSIPLQTDLSSIHDGSYILEVKTKLEVFRTRLILNKTN